MRKGIFITFEGGEACGKTTQIDMLREYFAANVHTPYHFVKEPGHTDLGERLRNILLHEKLSFSGKAELMMFMASRAQLYDEVIKPALDRNEIVIADRYYDSSIAYQASARGIMTKEDVLLVNRILLDGLKPDLTFYLNIAPEEALKRKNGYLDKFESLDMDFHHKVHEGYQWIVKKEPERFCVIDARLSPNEIHKIIVSELEKRFLSKK